MFRAEDKEFKVTNKCGLKDLTSVLMFFSYQSGILPAFNPEVTAVIRMDQIFSYQLPFEDPVIIFALVMLIILLAPMLAKKVKLPSIVGLILAGTVVGPGLLGLIERDFTIELLGTVGLLYLMFMAGLSLDLIQFEKLRNKSIGFGLVSFLLPQMAALAAGVYLLNYSVATSLLLGSIVGSHTLLAYPIAERLGITKNMGVTMSMGGTLVTDTLSLGVLAIVAGTAGDNSGAGYWTGFAASVIAFVAVSVILLPRLGRWFFRNVKSQGNMDYIFLVAILFTTAFFAELAGLAPIIGAFLAGLLLNRLVPGSGTLMSRVQFVGNALFIPFFLISVGMLVDVSVLGSLDVWFKAIIFTLLVFIGKGLASFGITSLFKFTKEEGFVIYGLTTPQSAATLAVTLIGFDLGFFDSTAVNAVVIMILMTCLVGPWLVEKYGREVATQEDKKPYKPSEAPQRILVPLANPETSDALMDIAFMVRDQKLDQPLYPLTVARDGRDAEEQVARGEKMLSHAVIHAAAANVPVNPVTRVDFNIAKGIARAVSEMRISNIIIGWNGQISAKQKIFGSILDQLLEEVQTMIMVSKIERPVNTSKRIVVAMPPFAEFEPGFTEAVRSLKLMADQIGDELVIVTTTARQNYVKPRVDNIQPEPDVTFEVIEKWGDLPAWYDDFKDEEDLFVLLSARDGSVSWRPGLDRLPRVIAQRYPQLSFITIYPAQGRERAGGSSPERENLQLLQQKRIKIGLEEAETDQVLEQIIHKDPAFDHIDLSRITKRLLKNSADYTPEVMPGVLLYEAHTSKVDEQLLFVGVSDKGLNLKQVAHPAHVILILLSPKSCSPEKHLEGVNEVAQLIKPGKNLKAVRAAKTAAEVYRAVMETEV
ncbi:cation:proton antiporter domain-containing protein [Rhodohalobacter halophilus]|uniref:cation:proton antiporter domain-containing protein n=1 Tax=Rhodohalobacter halophilus TaxID=1812810 RepID=UPI000AF19F9C|nr:cation:proton antiporter [Rhodohalobacter halophilus]